MRSGAIALAPPKVSVANMDCQANVDIHARTTLLGILEMSTKKKAVNNQDSGYVVGTAIEQLAHAGSALRAKPCDSVGAN